MERIGCIFDLDGVIVDTAKYHFLAWRRLANELGFDFNEKQNEKLKGVSRAVSLNLILEWGQVNSSEEDKRGMMAKKNNWYLEYVEKMSPDEILDGVVIFLEDLKKKEIPFALGSASKNAKKILRQIELYHHFDAIIDGTVTTRSKPHPEVFLRGADALHLKPGKCIVFEDAAKGIEAALKGGFKAVGIGEASDLPKAHLVIPNLKNRTIESIWSDVR